MTDLPPLVHIVGVTVIGDHERRMLFKDGTVGDVAFGGLTETRRRRPPRRPSRRSTRHIDG
jgi:hypothetical protein